MELRLLEGSGATVAAVAHVVQEGDPTEIVDVTIVERVAQIGHLEGDSRVVVGGGLVTGYLIKCNSSVRLTTVSSYVHFYLFIII